MGWRRPGDKPLSETIVACCGDYVSRDLSELMYRRKNKINPCAYFMENTAHLCDNYMYRVTGHIGAIYSHSLCRNIPWWRHQMDTFSTLQAICVGNSPVPGELPTQRPVTGALMFSLICTRIKGWVNNREAGDLRRHRANYDVLTMSLSDASMRQWTGSSLVYATKCRQAIT